MTSSTPEPRTDTPAATSADTPQSSGRHLSAGRLGAVAAGGVMALLLVLLGTNIGNAGKPGGPSPLVGQLVPAVSGTTLDGNSFDIDDYRGNWVAINFFASWCVACQQEHPELAAWQAEHAITGDAELVMIVMGDTDKAVRQYLAEQGGAPWPVLGQDYESYSLTFGVTAVPETFLVAPSGLIAAHITGATTAADLNSVIERYSQGA